MDFSISIWDAKDGVLIRKLKCRYKRDKIGSGCGAQIYRPSGTIQQV